MLTKKIFLIVVSGLLVSCSTLSRLGLALPGGPTVIAKIPIPAETQSTITVTGVVQQIVPLLERTAYQLEDASAAIWVISEATPPAMGESLKVTARVQYHNIPMGSEENLELYLIETERAAVSE